MEQITREEMIEWVAESISLMEDMPENSSWVDSAKKGEAIIASLQAAEPTSWMTRHDEPMLFLCEKEAANYCDDDERPIPLFTLPFLPAKAQVPEGYAAIPLDPRNGRPRITNEMKAEHTGEYSWEEDAPYYDEDGELIEHTASHVVPWDLCKKIYIGMGQTALLTAAPEHSGDGWVSVDKQLPEVGRKVLATYRNQLDKCRIIVADYAPRFTVESESEDAHDEYFEEKDSYFLCEGWYEQQENWGDYASIFVHEGNVTHWMPLPKLPQQEEAER